MLKRCFAAVLCIAFLAIAVPVVASAEALAVSASSAILYEPTTGMVLYEKNADERRAMASTTKLMTALLAAEWCDPEREITVTAEAVRVEGSSLGLRAGDTLTMRDLITGLLLVSGNDAANVVALTVCDSLPAFAEKMNARAAELGMNDTCFVTPSGLDAEEHLTTARDMAKLASAVLENELLAEICAKAAATVHIGNPKTPRTLTNHNRLLSTYEGTIGLKTGFTKKAGRCLVSAVRRNGVTLIAVTLRAPNDWNDHMALYDYGFTQVESVELAVPDLPALSVGGGVADTVTLSATQPSVQILPTGRADDVKAAVQLPRYLFAPVVAGDTVGQLVYTLDGKEICRVDMTVAHGVEERPAISSGTRFYRRIAALIQAFLT